MRRTFLIAATTALTLAASLPVQAAPLMPSTVAPQPDGVQQVQYRHWHGGYRRGYGGRWHGGGYGTGAAVLGGLAAGAIIGGAIASSQAQQNAQSYCVQRFRSYDPASGTYLGNDGMRHPCP